MQSHTRYNAPRLLHCDIKSDGTHIDRYLFDDGRVIYIETEKGTYTHPSHNEPPPFILGPWNWVVLAKHIVSHQVYTKTQTRVALRQVRSAWHPAHFDHLSLRLYENAAGTFVRSNVFMPPKPHVFHCNIVVKLAHTEDQIPAIENECNVYQMLEGLGIAPRFLGYVTEDGRKIGFIVEKIEGARHAELRDANVCETTVRRLHARGIVHNDCHSGNVLVKNGRAFLIDFETATAGYGIVGKDWDLLSRSLIR